MRFSKFFGIVLMLLLVSVQGGEKSGVKPKAGFIPDQNTAINVAKAVLIPIYGEKNIEGEMPLKASLNGEVWTIKGTLKPGKKGGVALVKISKMTGCILLVEHGA